MERVHFQQEQMLDELRDLVEKGLFTDVRFKGYRLNACMLTALSKKPSRS